jgi:gamma-glutamyltranspeptidase/glutathione hydrolase
VAPSWSLRTIGSRARYCLSLAILASLAASAPAAGATATGRKGAVAADHRLASEAGVEILAAGGNAVDAAVAAAFASGVVQPSSSGIGGGGFLLWFDTAAGTAHVVDFRETAPSRASRELFGDDPRGATSLRGGLAVAVPGEVRGLALAVERYGRLTLARVLEPAIRLAEEGFPVGDHLAAQIRAHAREISQRPALAAVFFQPDGSPYSSGQRLRRLDLAETLKRIAREGPEAFYRGDIARRIVQAVADERGVLTLEDLAAYQPRERAPLVGRYRDATVLAVPPPSSGGGLAIEALNILSGFELPSSNRRDPLVLHRVAEVTKLAFADRGRWYGDPEFVKVPLDRLLSAEYASQLRRRISPDRVIAPNSGGSSVRDSGTTHVSVVDGDGNAASLTTTINTAFGSMILVPGTGILLNDEMDDFATAPERPNAYGLVGTEANAVAPGKRPLSSMNPLILLRRGRPVLVLGASGGPYIVSATLWTLLNWVDFRMPLPEAVAAPRIHHQGTPDVLFVETGFEPSTLEELRRRGHRIEEVPEIGAVQAIEVTSEGLVAVSDDRKGGFPAGW